MYAFGHFFVVSLVHASIMSRGGSTLWTIESGGKQDMSEEPRSLWDRIESHLRPQEVCRNTA